ISITTRGDLVFGGAGDAGMADPVDQNQTPYPVRNADGTTSLVASGGQSRFTLWTPSTAIGLYAAGGDVAALDGNPASGVGSVAFYPGTLIAAAANGDIRFSEPGGTALSFAPIELAPSPFGQLALLAAGSIYGSSQVVAMSGADMSTLATPFHPVFNTTNASNASPTAPNRLTNGIPIAFGPDTPLTNLHAGDNQPALVYAGVDIVDLTIGQVQGMQPQTNLGFLPSPTTWYTAAKPFQIVAGRDIVGTGPTPDAIFNNPDLAFANAGDNSGYVSIIKAGRDIIYQSVTVAGSGLLDVQAGRNLYQGYYGMLQSVGPLFGANTSTRSEGAGIWVLAGVGPTGPNYAGFAKLYFDPANQLPGDGTPLAGSGKVVQTYDRQLIAWLNKMYGFTGSSADALTFFLGLSSEQQSIFVRQIYFAELTAGGREETGALASPRLGSYLRGREAIAALFPSTDAQGKPIAYGGDITMFSGIAPNGTGGTYLANAGIHTDFGGDIQILNPGGKTIIGVEGVAPGASAGLITQGSGNIDVYSLGSVLLGQSRIMTTFGGDIIVWSATGDINAGRGSKTTTIFTPPRRVYDNYGNITLSPTTPSAGAGIATLNPIPEVPPGNIDLIAPLGTIDAGEAGIRVSGNVNLAALQVVNAANIQVQGTSTGVPTVQGPPVGALTAASNTAAASQQAAAPPPKANDQPSIIIVEVMGYGGGSGDQTQPEESPGQKRQRRDKQTYNENSAFQVIGLGDAASSSGR
ncbi:filamentous hemagglutinin family protein, partial [Bradyrhizobium sp.]|uniref:filamentous haemagglutinin family protein n=1 Tax=Bradyrhizobium sp. TaxID=376 RepID=UPI003919CD45